MQLPRGKRNPFSKGLVRKYHLKSCHFNLYEVEDEKAASYRTKTIEAIEQSSANNQLYDLALIQTRESFHKLFGEENPYFVTKATLLTHHVPVQAIELETMRLPDSQLIYILNNLALACYAKMKGIPWVIRANQVVSHELVVGIGSSIVGPTRLGESKRVVGITTIFTGDGNYLLANRTQEATYDTYTVALLKSLVNSISRVQRDYNWQPKDSVRLIFHIFKPFKRCEIEAIKSVVSNLGDYDVQYAFVHVVDQHPYVLYDLAQQGLYDYKTKGVKGRLAPTRSTCIRIEADTSILYLTGPREIKTANQGLPIPILLRLDKDSTFKDLTYICITRKSEFFAYYVVKYVTYI